MMSQRSGGTGTKTSIVPSNLPEESEISSQSSHDSYLNNLEMQFATDLREF